MNTVQQQNVSAYTQGGIPGAIAQQQVLPNNQFVSKFQEDVRKSELSQNRKLGVYNELFGGESPLGGISGKEQSAIKILNIGHDEGGK
jgi:hypothetical protein